MSGSHVTERIRSGLLGEKHVRKCLTAASVQIGDLNRVDSVGRCFPPDSGVFAHAGGVVHFGDDGTLGVEQPQDRVAFGTRGLAMASKE